MIGALFLLTGDGGGGSWIASAFALAVLALPCWRYVTWLGRVACGTATDVDARRVRAWLRFYRAMAMLGLLGAGVAVWAGLRPLGSPTAPDTLESALLLLLAGASIRLLGDARKWIEYLTAAQKAISEGRLETLIRSATPWVRAVQITCSLFEMVWLVRHWQGDLFVSVDGLATTVLTILILEFSLRFSWASARERTPASSEGQPLL